MDAPLLPALPGYDNPQLIAHGTTALVFRATQARLNRLVAIKVITADTGSVPVNAARELATTVALSSQPHIVSIIDTGITDDDRPYIVMEYCEGGSYAQILRQRGPLPVDEVLEVGVKIGEALHAAHQVGIVHRDVKPSNILRSRFGPALTDFGIARAPDELSGTLTREMMTPHHASPEALLHQAQSGLSDVYSLASTMWTLLVGHPPFVDPTRPPVDMYAFRDRVLHEALPAMTRDDVPAWLVTELARAMSKLPPDRHASALDFAEALRRGSLGLSPGGPSNVWGSPPADRRRDSTAASASTASDQARGGTPAAGRPDAPVRGTVHATGLPPQAWPAAEPAPLGLPPLSARPVQPAPTSGAPISGSPSSGSPTSGGAPVAGRPPSYYVPTNRSELATPAGLGQARPVSGARPPTPAAPQPPGQWLGPDPAGAELETARQRGSSRRFADSDLRPGSGRKTALVMVLIMVSVFGVAAGAALVLNTKDDPQTPDTAVTSPTHFLTPGTIGAPRDVKLDDRGTSVVLSWVDPTAGTVEFLVTGVGSDKRNLPSQQVPRGKTTATVGGLSLTSNYCFRVSAVYGIDRLDASPEICTKR